MFVQGSIGSIKGLRFLIDTGTSWTLVDRRLVTRLGLSLVPYAEGVVALDRATRAFQATVPVLEFGPVRRESHPVLVMDLGRIHGLGPIDAVIGLETLRRASFRIDYRSHRLSFGPLLTARTSIPFRTTAPLLSVDATIDGHPVCLIVDTGASRLTLFSERMGRAGLTVGGRGGRDITGIAGRTHIDLLGRRRVRLGDSTFALFDGAVLQGGRGQDEAFDGILGGLSRAAHSIGFDFTTARLQFE